MLYLVARLLPGILAVATTSILTRLLTPEAYGIYGLTLIIMSFGSTIAFEWLGLSFMRFYEGRQNDARTIPTFVMLYYGMVGLTALLLPMAIVSTLVATDDITLFAVGFCMAWSFAFFELLARFEVASFRPGRYLMMNLGRALLLMVFTLGAAWLTHKALYTAIGNALGLIAAIALVGRRRLAFHRNLFDPSLARQIIRFGLPFALSMLLAGLFTSGVRSLVAILTSTQELGLYTAAYSLSQNVLMVIASAIGSATYPLAVRAVERGDKVALKAQLEENFALLLGTLMPAALGMALTSRDLAIQLVGAPFRSGVVELMPWMALTVALGSTRGTYLDHAFQLGKKSTKQVIVSAGAAVLALAGTLILVPWMGAVGAPVATSIAMLISCIHAHILGKTAQPMPLPPRVLLQVGSASAVMAVAVLAIPSGLPYSLYAKIAAGAASYGLTCVAANLLGLRVRARGLLVSGAGRLRSRWAH
jgi:O-antigen/teichoic acid export membrane protein